MTKRLLVSLALFAAICAQASATAIAIGFLDGDIAIQMPKEEYVAGEMLDINFAVSNKEAFPIANAFVVAEIVRGLPNWNPNDAKNPLADYETVFEEKLIKEINLRPIETLVIPFKYQLPEDLAEGTYRIDAWFAEKKSNIQGIVHDFIAPRQANFRVKAKKGGFPTIRILRTKTRFNGQRGPVGPPTAPGSMIDGRVFIANDAETDAKGLSLWVGLCDFDDSACGKWEDTKTVDIEAIPANGTKEVQVGLTAPTLPSAYAIRIEVRDKNNRLLSMYRNRTVVIGATARVRQLVANNFEFKQGQQMKIKLIVGPSPDHYNYPAFKNFNVQTTVQDLDTNEMVFSNNSQVQELGATAEDITSGFLTKEFSFEAPKDTNHFKVCSEITKDLKTFDKHCVEYDASKFSKVKVTPEIQVKWEFKGDEGRLYLSFCNSPAAPIKANYFIVVLGGTDTIAEENIVAESGCVEKKHSAQLGNYSLVLTDFNTKRQKIIDLRLEDLKMYSKELKKCAELNGKSCGKGEQCNVATIETLDNQKCCTGECVLASAQAPGAMEFAFSKKGLAVIAVIVILVLLGLLVRREHE